jgi:phosphoglycerate kinase
MSGIKYFPQDLNIENKNIILRLDFNVPLKNKQIQDYTRISTVLPLLKDLVKRKSKIIILSHLGRPEGLKINDLSLLPVFKYLKKQLDTNIYFYTGEINELAKNKVSFLKSGEIILFENIRFFEGENKNDENFSEKLGGLADIFINDAFSCSHRAQASIHKITKFVKNLYGGPLLKKEINAIDLVIKNKKKPVTCIIGGSKISTKINVISNLMKNVDSIILVGAMANNFLAYKGFKVGKSLVESDSKKIIDKIYDDAKENNCKIIIPSDYSVSTSFDGSAKTRLQNKITDDEIILDIGPQTIEKIEDIIDKSNTVLWNGPAGYFENKNFAKGTVSIANKISQNTINRSLISILGGGDTVSAVNKIENELFFTHLSTAGGAFLEYLEGKDLPGLSVLK